LRSKLRLIPAAVAFVILLPVFGQVNAKRDLGGPGVWSLPDIQDVTPVGGVPFNSKGKQVWDERRTQPASDPARACLPPGVPRIMYSSYSMEILQVPNRVVIVYEGGTHIFRSIPIGTKAGLKHPPDPNPTYMGDSYGWWEGDSLMVDVVGFNDRSWLDASGHPHGEKLHVVEKFTRLNSSKLAYTATVDDPEYYTRPWTVTTSATYRPNDRLKEVICQENQEKQ
jgi:hypothetical protein